MNNFETLEHGKLLISAINIIEKLAKNAIADIDLSEIDDDIHGNKINDCYVDELQEVEKLKSLILDARKLTRNQYWSYLK